MDVVTSKAQLLQAVSLPQSIAQKKATMPVLVNVVISAEKGEIAILGSDLEVSVRCTCKADVEHPGAIAVNAKMFGDLVRQLPDGEVQLQVTSGERLEVRAQRSILKLLGVPAATFPKAPGMEFSAGGKINSVDLAQGLERTIYAASHDETRFNLNGVFFQASQESDDGTLVLVATDGYRLAQVTCPIKGMTSPRSIIVPRRGLLELKKALDMEGEREVQIGIDTSFLIVETSQAKLSLQLIDGEYPDYKQVIPSTTECEVFIPTTSLVNALRRAMLVVYSDEKCSTLTFEPGLLKIKSASVERGEVDEEIEIEYEGEPLSIGFNPGFLLEAVSSFSDSSSIRVRLSGSMGPGLFSASDDERSFAVIMPMRL